MAIIRNGKPLHISIHHSAVNPPAHDRTTLVARARAHNNTHRPNSEIWNNITLGEFGYDAIRYHHMFDLSGNRLQVQDEKYVLYSSGDGAQGTFNYWGVHLLVEGNFETARPTEELMRALVDFIRDFQKRYNVCPMVRGHSEISPSPTACPGRHLGTSNNGFIKDLIANVNNPNYVTDWRSKAKKLSQTRYITNRDTSLFEIQTGKQVKNYPKGTEITLAYEYGDYYITEWSFKNNIFNGFRKSHLELYKEPVIPAPEVDYLAEIKKLEAEISSMAINYATHLDKKQQKITNLEDDVRALQEDVTTLTQKKSVLSDQNQMLHDTNLDLQNINQQLSDDIEILEERLKEKDETPTQEEGTAFTRIFKALTKFLENLLRKEK